MWALSPLWRKEEEPSLAGLGANGFFSKGQKWKKESSNDFWNEPSETEVYDFELMENLVSIFASTGNFKNIPPAKACYSKCWAQTNNEHNNDISFMNIIANKIP